MALLLGLRRGEIFGLSWSDIDLDAKTLRVSQQLQREPKIGPVLKRTKTVGSVRTLPIPANLVPVLAARKEWERLDRAVAGSTWKGAWDGERLLFRSRMGGPAIPDTALKQFRQLLDGLGLPAQRLHDLRHNCASLLFAQGIPARLVMELLGHSNIGITMNFYTHPQFLRKSSLRSLLRDDGDLVAELAQALYMVVGDPRGVERVEVVGAALRVGLPGA